MKINLVAPITHMTSYGNTSINIIRELIKKGVEVAAFSIGQPESETRDGEFIRVALENATRYNKSATSIRIWHNFNLAEHIGKGPHIGFSIWELDNFNERETYHMNNQDALASCSEWAINILKDKFVGKPIYKIPLGVDRTIFNEDVEPLFPKGDKTVFLTVGKWEKRKGHDEIATAFSHAFKPSDNVELIYVPLNVFIGERNKEWFQRIKSKPLSHKIKIWGEEKGTIERIQSSSDVARLMRYADCLVAPSRAEGWLLPGLEALSCGSQLITTNYSAQTEYVNSENSMLIDIDRLEPACDGVFFDGTTGSWASIGNDQMEQLVNYMRTVHVLKSMAALPVNTAGVETAKRFSWERTAQSIINMTQSLV